MDPVSPPPFKGSLNFCEEDIKHSTQFFNLYSDLELPWVEYDLFISLSKLLVFIVIAQLSTAASSSKKKSS